MSGVVSTAGQYYKYHSTKRFAQPGGPAFARLVVHVCSCFRIFLSSWKRNVLETDEALWCADIKREKDREKEGEREGEREKEKERERQRAREKERESKRDMKVLQWSTRSLGVS